MESKLKDVSTIMNMYEKRRSNAGKTCSLEVIVKLSTKLMYAMKCSSSINPMISIFKVPESTALCDLENISLATCIRNVKDDLNQENYKCIMYHIYVNWVSDEDCSIIQFKRHKFRNYTIHSINNTNHILLIEPTNREKNREELDNLRDSEAIQSLINSDPTLSDIDKIEYAEIIYKEQLQGTLSFKRKREQMEEEISSENSSPHPPPSPPSSNISRQIKIEHDSDAYSVSTLDMSVPIHTDLQNNTEGMDNFKIAGSILNLINSDTSVSDTEWNEYAEIINNELNNQNNSVNTLLPYNTDNLKSEYKSDIESNSTLDSIETTSTTATNECLNDEKEMERAEGSSDSRLCDIKTETETTLNKEIQKNQINTAFHHLVCLFRFANQQRNSRACYLIEEIWEELRRIS